MASADDSRSPLINRPSSGTLLTVRYDESRIQIPASRTAIVTDSNSTSSVPFIRSSMNKDATEGRIQDISTISMSYRLGLRKALIKRLGTISDIMCFLALLGIVIMIIENELEFARMSDEDTKTSWSLKLIITITTIILVALVFYYHRLQLQLYSIKNAFNNSTLGLTSTKICLITVEVIICAIHPIPLSFPQNSKVENINSNSTIIDSCTITPIPLSCISSDVALGLPMFARLYLPCRCLMFHSHLFRDVTSRSLGYLNQVSIDYFFLMKAYFQHWPTRSLAAMCTIVFLIGSWSLRACDYITSSNEHMTIFDSMWLLIVTFTTVGYGDLTPTTYCGRTVASLISLISLLASALLITALAQKLVFARPEKYVYNFVLNTELAKEREHQAANVVKYSVRLWCMKKQGKATFIQRYQVRQRLYGSILSVQNNERERRKLIDSCLDIIDLATMQRKATTKIDRTAKEIRILTSKVDKIEANLIDINQTMGSLQNTLNVLLDKLTK